MKVRNILIGLLVVLMAFVFISCEDEPEEVVPTPQPGPAPVDDNTIAKITATAGIDGSVWKNEKLSLQWDLKKAFGEETEGIKNGSVLTLQFRTSRDIHMIDLRTNKKGVINKETDADDGIDTRWLYEEGSLDKLDSLELGEDGWYTLKYTFTEEFMSKTAPDYDKYYYTNLLMNFAGYLMEGDVLEVKNAFLDGQALPLTETEDNKILYSTSTSTMETVTAHDWTIAKTYAVVYALGGEWRSDAGVPVEAVAAGGKATGVPATNGFTASYTLGEEAFDLNTAINSDLILSYTLTPVQWTVTFDTKGGSEMQPKQVTHGTKLSLTNEELPTYPTYEFLGWFLDSDCTQEFDLATETITGSITLYAGWAQNVRHVTIDLDNAEGTDDVSVKNVVDGGTVTASWFATPIKPGSYFAGWYVGEDAFNPATPITADITVKAHWTEPTTAYKLVATKASGGGTDKFIISWVGDTSLDLEKDDILSFQYRSTASFNMFNVRGADKWFYEAAPDGTYLKISEPDEDGWISVTFKFAEKYQNEHIPNAGSAVNYATSNEFRFDFINQTANAILVNDILEVKGIALNGEELPLYMVDGSSSGYCTAAVANGDIASIIVPIADWPASVTVTFDYGDKTVPTPVNFGETVALPDDAAAYKEAEGKTFVGWFTDSGTFLKQFNSNAAMTGNITVYGYWVEPVTVTLHTDGGTGPTAMDVPYGSKIKATDIQVGKAGYSVEWYANEGLTTPFDFENTTITEATGIWAKWIAPTKAYQFTATVSHGRFQWRLRETIDTALASIQPGDVITFQVKFTTALTPSDFRLRTRSGECNITGIDSDEDGWSVMPAAGGDGWYTVTVVAPVRGEGAVDKAKFSGKGGLYLAFEANANWAIGDVCVIKAFTYNGHELALRTGAWADNSEVRDFGAYDAVKPNSAEIAP